MDDGQSEHRIVPYRTYVQVWLALLALTGATVGASLLNLGRTSTATSLLIASAKCSLVLGFFMGLKYDRPIFHRMLMAALFTFAIFLILTYGDYVER